jgi:glycosyl transferase family 25
MINIKECKKYIINLEKRPDRLAQTLKNLNNKNYYDIKRFNAFEIKSIDEAKKYVTPESMYPIIKKQRTAHNQLSIGAVGCFLSHLEIYKMLANSNDDYVLIFEDDTLPSLDIDELQSRLNDAPTDWDIFLIGGIYKKKEYYNDNIYDVKRFILLHSYLISKKCAKKIIDNALPMNQQIDWWLSDLATNGKIKIYGLIDSRWKQNPLINDTNIQTPMLILEKFNNYNNNNNINIKKNIYNLILGLILFLIFFIISYILFVV